MPIIIEIPGYDDLRISGERNDWQVQRIYKKGKNAGEWYGTNFFPAIEFAVGFVYERMLRDAAKTVDIADVPDECRRVKASLLKAVKKAVAS